MKNIAVILMTIIFLPAFGPGRLSVYADMLIIAHDDVFGPLRRPPVEFPHDCHMDALDDEGCGACHHSWDDTADGLVYIEGEELNCYECHLSKNTDDLPALREAYHGNCNVCHRQLIRAEMLPSGPITCGECHRQAE